MEELKLTKDKLLIMINDFESELIERTMSVKDFNKFAQAICAFSNDLPNNVQNGYLLIGVHDNGNLSGIKIDDRFLQTLGGLRSDGNILPQPIMSIKVFSLDGGDVIVIEVTPSPFPPVRYKGKTWIRVGPRKAVANEMEERILIERRSANVSMFDIRPCIEAILDDLQTDLFKTVYLPQAIDSELLKNDKRDIKEQLAALRFYNIQQNCPTNAGVLLLAKNPEYFIPGGYVQYVRFKGKSLAGDILNEKKFSGNLITIIPKIDTFIDDAIITHRPIPISTLREKVLKNFPNWAIRELMMNAVMHRDYESNAPIKFYQFDDRIEISNAGGLFGKARPENFPNENDYRNPTIAEAMRVLGYVNRFNRGISRVQEELTENRNDKAIFDFKNITSFGVTVNDASFLEDESIKSIETQEINKDKLQRNSEEKLNKFGISSEEIRNKFGRTSLKILENLLEDSESSAEAIAKKTNLSDRAIEKNIAKLKKAGIIDRIGTKKSGYWKIMQQK